MKEFEIYSSYDLNRWNVLVDGSVSKLKKQACDSSLLQDVVNATSHYEALAKYRSSLYNRQCGDTTKPKDFLGKNVEVLDVFHPFSRPAFFIKEASKSPRTGKFYSWWLCTAFMRWRLYQDLHQLNLAPWWRASCITTIYWKSSLLRIANRHYVCIWQSDWTSPIWRFQACW